MLAPKIIDLKKKLMDMAGYIQKMVEICINSMKELDVENLKDVKYFEDKVNQLELEIDDRCATLIALFQPEAKDLRYILMIIKMNNDFERLGDLANKIGDSLLCLKDDKLLFDMKELYTMATKSYSMLKDSIMAFTDEDVETSAQIGARDDEVDELYEQLYVHIKQVLRDTNTKVEPSLHILRIASKFERIADLSTNIGESTIYLVKGANIKHR
ncbi:MAG: phosphate transport system regulatory protein PhoU [Candidatus Cloacimonetes bacterium 4572_65]|nr:MAG: phosphate transport system regulatory protein PhoU [Candidatus Cloacimonetes bacterium 4572_65]